MAELLGRIERIAVAGGGQQQITGQAQVKFSYVKIFLNYFFL